MKTLLFIYTCILLSGCSAPTLGDYAGSKPVFELENYFTGPLTAQGIVVDRNGKVTRRFSVNMLGTWQDNQGKLEEWFVFDDGEKTTRTWLIDKQADGTYSGRAHDIVGQASGAGSGMAVRWDYQLDLQVGGKEYRVTFDDWLYQIDQHVVINRSYIKKWGFTVGEVILVINKIAP